MIVPGKPYRDKLSLMDRLAFGKGCIQSNAISSDSRDITKGCRSKRKYGRPQRCIEQVVKANRFIDRKERCELSTLKEACACGAHVYYSQQYHSPAAKDGRGAASSFASCSVPYRLCCSALVAAPATAYGNMILEKGSVRPDLWVRLMRTYL